MRISRFFLSLGVIGVLFSAGIGFCAVSYAAELIVDDVEVDPNLPPPSLDQLLYMEKKNKDAEDTALPLDIRRDAIKEAALSLGARGGLAWRSYAIRKELETRGRYLDKVYNFRQLLISAPSGFVIEPPIINESVNALLIDTGGQTAAVSERVYNIINNAKIVSTPRTWHTYLDRVWGEVEPPPDILLPQTKEERALWVELVRKGWEQGIIQADDTFETDLNRLNADFMGMVRYRKLLAQGMVSPPYALQVDMGVTGNGEEMRIGDRSVQITGKPQLMTGFNEWKPANR